MSDAIDTAGPRRRLGRILRDLKSCVVAFSGGVDSTLLLKVAADVLGDGATAVTAVSPSLAAAERDEAAALARAIGVRHLVVATHEMDDPAYVRNDADRCYHCKSELFTVLDRIVAAHPGVAVVYGAIVDDLGDDRPGMRAAEEHGVRAPLAEAGFTKPMVRALAFRLGLPNWDKPAMACLASRIPRLTPVSAGDLARVEAAEAAGRRLGYRQIRVRLRTDGGARVELDATGLARCARTEARRRLVAVVRRAGFADVVIDPAGYRPGGRPARPIAVPRA